MHFTYKLWVNSMKWKWKPNPVWHIWWVARESSHLKAILLTEDSETFEINCQHAGFSTRAMARWQIEATGLYQAPLATASGAVPLMVPSPCLLHHDQRGEEQRREANDERQCTTHTSVPVDWTVATAWLVDPVMGTADSRQPQAI